VAGLGGERIEWRYTMKRAVKYEINSVITTIIVIAIIVVVIMIAQKHPYRFDLTKQKKYSLSDQTVKILKRLVNPVKAIGFFGKGSGNEDKAKTLLQEYQYTNPKFSFEMVDPDKNPLIAKKYDITLPGVIVMESKDKKEKAREVSEESLTNALVKVTSEGKKSVYFLTGHGELTIDSSDNNGLANLKESLEKEVYTVKPLSFVSEKKVPDDASLVVIVGPSKPLFKEELDILRKYIADGGRLFCLLGIESPDDLNTFLGEYGYMIQNDVIIDQVSRMFGGDFLIPAIMQYGTHPIVEKFRLVCFFPMSRSVQIDNKKKPEGSELSELAFSSQKSWAETDMKMVTAGKAKFDAKTDKAGPLCIAAAGTYKVAGAPAVIPSPSPSPGDKKDEKKARMVVFGSAEVADNAYISQSGNRDLVMNAVSWLAEEEKLISIRAKDESGSPLTLTPQDNRLILFFTVFFLPFLIIFIGIWVRIRRG